MNSDPAVAIVWFESNLRLADNRAVVAAAAPGNRVVACYVLDDDGDSLGGASRWWLHRSLEALGHSLQERGVQLVLRSGPAERELAQLVEETGASEIHAGARVEPDAIARHARAAAAAERLGATLRLHRGSLLFDPNAIRTGQGQPFKVFTPFWRACLAEDAPGAPEPIPRAFSGYPQRLKSESLERWGLLPAAPNWARGFETAWSPGENGAHARLSAFVDAGLEHYRDRRDRPDLAGTSQLSPHLRFGELSPRQVWHAVRLAVSARPALDGNAQDYLRQIGWREFSQHLLRHWPRLPSEPLRPEFAEFGWEPPGQTLRAWQRGVTGYPIVDAGMRQLWACGWMHNRVRMVAASFLVKHLLVPWQHGAEWFLDTLVDADLGNNSASWQWVAGCGTDAAPYFRIFNPVLQGEKFDPDGDYVRQWVPELREMPSKYVHAPWRATPQRVDSSAVEYAAPIVEHRRARERALAAYHDLRERPR